MTRNKGFTLIELLVVIAIIGILSSVVLASLNSARQKARDAQRISDVKQIQLAAELYFDSCSNYPNTIALATSNGCSGTITFKDFMSVIPTDPLTTSGYYYHSTAATGGATACTGYHLGATLENTGHTVLKSDADVTTDPLSACDQSGGWVTGADPVYDVIP